MTATNHVVTGAVVAAALSQPLIAVIAAFMTHFLLDMLPHFGMKQHNRTKFLYYLAIDFALALAFLLSLVFLQPPSLPLILICSVVCAAPDLLWLPDFVRDLRGAAQRPTRLKKLLSDIQWAESPKGIIFELVWLGAMFWLLPQLAF